MQPKKAYRGQPSGWRIISNPKSWYPVPEYAMIVSALQVFKCYHLFRYYQRKTENEGLSANIWCSSASDGKNWKCPVVPRLERNSAGWTAQLLTLWLRGAAKQTDEEENEMLEYDSPAVMNNRMSQSRMTRPHLMIVTLFGTRDFGRSICFNSRIVFSWIFFISLVMEATGLPSPFF